MAFEFGELSLAEQRVVEATARGELALIDRTAPAGERAVRAGLLRQLLLRLPKGDGFAESFPVRLPGVRVLGACVTGELDLRDCAGPGGEGLPALELMDCEIADGVDFSHARLARLSFRGSLFSDIKAHGVRIDGPFDFSDGGFPKGSDDALAAIDLTGALIAGEVVGRGARLRLMRRDGNPEPWAHKYAFRLSDAVVQGSVNLNDGFYADGGATISASHIHGELWLARATLVAARSNAFNARGTVINGPVMMTDGFNATGRVGLRGAEIKGDLSLGRERATPEEGDRPRDRAVVRGALDIRGALIDGTLDLSGATFEHPGKWAVNAAGARIGDDITVRPGSHIAGESMTLISGGLRFDGAKVGGEVIWDGLCFTGEGPDRTLVSLADASIERALKPRRLELRYAVEGRSPDKRPRIDLSGAHCAALDDDLAHGWGPRSVLLMLDGFEYGRLERDARRGRDRSPSDRWPARKIWLRERAEWDGYHPQPYAHLARVYADAGWSEDMRRVLRRQRTLHARLVERWWMQPFVFVHWLVAGYGYAPQRAVATLLVYLSIGWFGVDLANERGALVRDLTPISSEEVVAPWCGEQISSPLYALDVAVPLLDLRQESECEPGAAPDAKLFPGFVIPQTSLVFLKEVDFWRWAKALYALFGALMTAIAVLTFTGVLQTSRRY